jgi:hypothetical protein
MATIETLKALCYNERNELKTRIECRAAMINHLILEEMVDVDEAEDLTDKALLELNLWPTEEKGKPTPAT